MDRSTPPLASLRLGAARFRAGRQRRKFFSAKSRTKSRRRLLFLRVTCLSLLLLPIGLGLFLIRSYRGYARIVDARLANGYLISRAGIYAAPRTVRIGQKYSRDQLAAVLRRAGYVESDDVTEIWNGSFAMRDNSIEIRPNPNIKFPSLVRIDFGGDNRIAQLTGDGLSLESFELAPESLTNDATMKSGARAQLTFKDIPLVLVHAITSIEDQRFFDHSGVDIFGVARALLRNAGDERIGQGGSTITQQLIKNTYLTPERTLRRKYAEAMLAFTLERRLSKEDIFALYCDEIFLGQRGAIAIQGVDQAARIYFGKRLTDLSLAEAATIAGMIQSPTRYSPVHAPDASRARRNTVLGTMVRDGFISLAEAGAAAKEPVTIAEFDPARESVAPYFIDYVNRYRTPSDSDRKASPAVSEGSESKPLITTLDLDLQQIAGEALKRQLDHLDEVYKPRGLTAQAALVALDPRTGNVLAMVGGRDYAQSQLNRGTDARRQPGSVFKPFVYAAALESGMSPLRLFRDAPQEFTYAGKQKYRPTNYGGGFSMRDVPMRTGLVKSLNVVTVDVAVQTGLARVANTALKFGLPRPEPYPALALGTTEVTPLQIAAAYATFANGGFKIQPQVIGDGKTVAGDQVIAPTTAFMITDMLEGVIDHGTARLARGSIPGSAVAGKTGTSRDGWFVGYTPNLVCAVWIGFDDNTQLGLTGAEAALPVWTEFMKRAVDLRPELGGKFFAQPAGITIAEIDPETEELATGKCPTHELVAILTDQAPTSECFRHNVYFELSENLTADNSPAEARRARSLNTRGQPLPSELASLHDTSVDTDKRGRKILVTEMKAFTR